MVTRKQRREIEAYMQRIKDAKNSGADQKIIKKRTAELMRYLEQEGLTDLYND
jgi:hypothetical protein